jgi:hypothetical protein
MKFSADNLGSRCKWLFLVIGGVWLLTVIPARQFFGMEGLEAVTVSALSCLPAGCLTFWFASRFTQPRMQAFSVLFGTMLRGLFALLGAIVMHFLLDLPYQNYLIWLAVFYLVSLGLETALMMKPPTRASAA